MTEEELINQVWKRLKKTYPKATISKRTTARVIKTFLKTLAEEVLKGEQVKLRNFGTFHLKIRKYKTPDGLTGKSHRVAFKPSKKLKKVGGIKL
jgi:nucleoid DNA-binding protein